MAPTEPIPPQAPRPDTWILVVNWNGAALLGECLSALLRQTRPAHVVVVDNGSTDGSAQVVARFSAAEWLPVGRNSGFAEANNLGLRRALAAGARWIGLVNPDVVVEPDWVERLVGAGEAHEDTGILGGLLLFADDPQRVNSTGLVVDRVGRAFDRDFGVPLPALARADGPVLGITGGAALLRADMLRRIGLFDPAYWAYYEDLDLALRAAAAGIGARYVSAARARHGYGKSFGGESPQKRYLLARNHLRAMATHLPLPYAIALTPALSLLRAAVRAPLELVRGRPAHAAAHLRGAGAGAIAALQVIGRRIGGGAATVPPGAEVVAPLGDARPR